MLANVSYVFIHLCWNCFFLFVWLQDLQNGLWGFKFFVTRRDLPCFVCHTFLSFGTAWGFQSTKHWAPSSERIWHFNQLRTLGNKCSKNSTRHELLNEPANRRWQQKSSPCAEHAPMLASQDGYLSLRANTESGQAAGHVLSQHDSNFQNRRLITWWISVHSQNVLKSSLPDSCFF